MGENTQNWSGVSRDRLGDESRPQTQPINTSEFPSYDPQGLDQSRHSLAYLEGPAPRSQEAGEPLFGGQKPTRYFEGLSRNAGILGISKADLLRVDSQSPFTKITFEEGAQWNIPESLRPTPTQHRYPHHPFFDCIPIPGLRDRLVLATSTDPPLINRFDICYDMFAGGLTFRDDSTVEENWQHSREFATKWRALLQMDTSMMLRHIENSQRRPAD